ncbi:MAG TPA: hypothetical protein V6D02_05010 [Candidatus Obscuribacterales bacterium]
MSFQMAFSAEAGHLTQIHHEPLVVGDRPGLPRDLLLAAALGAQTVGASPGKADGYPAQCDRPAPLRMTNTTFKTSF